MKFHVTTALALGLAALSTPALAQTSDGFDRDSHFDGPYIGAFGGLGIVKDRRSDSIVFDTTGDGVNNDVVRTSTGANAFSPGFCAGAARGTTPDAGCRRDRDGAEYGIRIGMDSRMGENFVVGGLIEGHRSRSRDATSAFSTTPANYVISRRLDYAISARARAGFTPGGGALFYVTGGGSYAKINHRFTTTNTANSFDERRDGKMVWGWQAGGGSELMLTNNISLGMEYLYSRYRDNKYNIDVGPGTAPPTNPFLIESGGTNMELSNKRFQTHSLRATVGYRF